MQVADLEKLKESIERSSLLNTQEKAEWLSLLSVMNDKQLRELGVILASALPLKVPLMPSHGATLVESQKLSHIKNLPKPVSGGPLQNFQKPRMAEKQKQDFGLRLDRTLHEKELAAPEAEVTLPLPAQAHLSAQTPPVPKPPASKIGLPLSGFPTHHGPLPVVTHQPLRAMDQAVVVGLPKNIADIAALDIRVFRSFDLLPLVEALRVIVRSIGYFDVLFALEQSPLYKTYLYMGNKILEENLAYSQLEIMMQTDGKNYLTKPEFEKFTDILRKIQVN